MQIIQQRSLLGVCQRNGARKPARSFPAVPLLRPRASGNQDAAGDSKDKKDPKVSVASPPPPPGSPLYIYGGNGGGQPHWAYFVQLLGTVITALAAYLCALQLKEGALLAAVQVKEGLQGLGSAPASSGGSVSLSTALTADGLQALGSRSKREDDAAALSTGLREGLRQGLREGLRQGLREGLQGLGAWLAAGAVATAVVPPVVYRFLAGGPGRGGGGPGPAAPQGPA